MLSYPKYFFFEHMKMHSGQAIEIYIFELLNDVFIFPLFTQRFFWALLITPAETVNNFNVKSSSKCIKESKYKLFIKHLPEHG